MKTLGFAAVLLIAMATSANATPIAYSFTATWSFEADSTIGPPPVPLSVPVSPSHRIFSPADTITGSFVYDSETPVFVSFPSGTLYQGAVTDFTATVGAYEFFSPAGFGSINTFTHSFAFNGALDAMTIGDWASPSFFMIFSNFSDSSLPAALPPPGLPQLSLNFTNNVAGIRRQVAFSPVVVTQVSEPGITSLFLLGIFAIIWRMKVRSRGIAGHAA